MSTLHPSPSACILGVIVDEKLSWQLHLQHIKSKQATQANILTRLTVTTWGTSLQVLRLLYTAVVCSIMATCYPAWWATPEALFFRKGIGEE
jgi:ABC-type lipoprotein release transport system permease subunit